MKYVFDILMLSVSTMIMRKSLILIAHQKSKSIADYAIILLYIFQCVPVICDILIGIPVYNSWLNGFKVALNNDTVSFIYDLYILALFISLHLVSNTSNKKYSKLEVYTWPLLVKRIPNCVMYILIIAPFVHVILSGNLSLMYIYGSYSARGLLSSFTKLNGLLIITSIIVFFIWLFKKEMDYKRWIIFVVYSVLISWINGKRYIVITVIYSFFYLYTSIVRTKKRKKLLLLMMVATILVIVYASVYLINVRMIGDSFMDLYSTLRIDLGRDDVVKYTILKEYIEGEHILEYPCQTVISTLFMIVPRAIFPAKAYPHYAYLTASLYGTTVYDIPSGMTPSLLEMMIANFRWFGIPICILFLCQYCKWADSAKTYAQKFLYSLLLMGMLSQSLDAMLVVFYFVIFFILTRRVKFVFGRR